MEYFQELERRTRAIPAVGINFGRGLGIFERGWSGAHAVDEQAYLALRLEVEEMRQHANSQ